jgi:beta-glucosidase/6-phospho-beta-glucosidase/beta-galactosidase
MVQSLEANYRERRRNKYMLALAAKARTAAMAALKAWPGQIDPKGLKKIAVRIGQFEKIYGNTPEFSFFSSTALGILEDISHHINDHRRMDVLDTMISAINQIHRYFDRNLDKTTVYQRAAVAVNAWHGLEA